MGRRRWHRGLNWSSIVAIVCLVAQLGLAGAGYWHRHSDGDGRVDDCAVCLAVAADKTDGLPPRTYVSVVEPFVGLVVEVVERDGKTERPSQGRPRGPPGA